MTILETVHWRNDERGRRQCVSVPANSIEAVLEAISRYWSDPYSNLGFLRAVARNKSHPGARGPHPPELE